MKPDFPSLADEIAEPHPDMNIKVAAFAVSEKSSNTIHLFMMDTNQSKEDAVRSNPMTSSLYYKNTKGTTVPYESQ